MRTNNIVNRILLCFYFCFLGLWASGQENEHPGGIRKLVDHYKNKGVRFENVTLFTPGSHGGEIPDLTRRTVLKFQRNTFDFLYNGDVKYISVPVVINGRSVVMDLVKRDFFTKEPLFTISNERGMAQKDNDFGKRKMGVHYAGYVVGEEANSVVSFSIFEGKVYGLINCPTLGNVAITKLKKSLDDDTYVAYEANDLSADALAKARKISCEAAVDVPGGDRGGQQMPHPDGGEGGEGEQGNEGPEGPPSDDGGDGREGEGGPQISASSCVEVFLEVSNDLYDDFGGDLNEVRQFAISLFSQSATIYLNELVVLKLTHMNNWTSPSPYSSLSGSSAKLNMFQSVWGSIYIGDIAHLIDNSNDGGRGFRNDNMCRPLNTRMCFSGLSFWPGYYQTNAIDHYNFFLPVYQWELNVFCHEMGHVFGSHHTHDCVWNGNSTAIDGCGPTAGYGSSPGGCSTGPLPTGAGTIMSYCHLNVGVNFFFGFGPQPGNKIRFNIFSSDCLSECSIDCPFSASFYENQQIITNPSTNGVVNTASFVYTTATYNQAPGNWLEYTGGNYVLMDPGFEMNVSPSGSVYLAHIRGCELDPMFLTENLHGLKPSGNRDADEQAPDAIKQLADNMITISPNPVVSTLNVGYNCVDDGDLKISVTDISGRIVRTANVSCKKGVKTNQVLDMSSVQPGMYFIKLQAGNKQYVEKIIKQ